ncbi:MAG TPA: iron uptake system protein EfeO, partial [Marmoricola sp.]|nr:iron uptake system protein EfeO [Marmoricola sp.]
MPQTMPEMNLSSTRVRATLLTAALLPVVAACGSSSSSDKPAAAAKSDGHSANVTLTAAKGCSIDSTTFKAGGIDFKVSNKDATAISEVEILSGDRIVGEKENLPPGFSGTFSITAGAGDYTLYCPGASTEKTALKVTGQAAAVDNDTATLLKQASDGYAAYVSTQVGYLLDGVQKLNTALQGTDLAAAQTAYAKARPFYEKIEPVAESFTVGKVNLDANIDARANDVPASQFMGFHRIEKGLFADKSLTGLASYGAGLVTNVEKLQKLTTGLSYQPAELANGAVELLDEVATSKVTGEEERYSHIDMLDFANNDEGSEQAFAQLVPVLTTINPTLTTTIQDRFAALDTLVNTY